MQALTACALLFTLALAVENPEEFPNLLAGTFSDPSFSTGNTLPIVARPFGFNHWSLHNSPQEDSWWFNPNLHEFRWLRLTHQPSPWISDWAWVKFGPQMGPVTSWPTMFFEPRAAHLKPYGIDITLAPDGMRIHFTPTDHGGVLKVEFPVNNVARRICFCPSEVSHVDKEAHAIEMISTRRQSDHVNPTPGDYGLRLLAELDTKSLRSGARAEARMEQSMGCFELSTDETEATVWIGTSLISAPMARRALSTQVARRPYDAVLAESRMVWRRMLSRIDVVDAGGVSAQAARRLTIFYTGLYRSLLFPRRLDELDERGKRVHYSPFDPQGKVHDGPMATDNGFWDTFRTCYTLLALAYPDELAPIIDGWLNAFREGGWLPQWSSPGYRSAMVGTFSDNIVADAVLKDVIAKDHPLAYEALRRDAFAGGGHSGHGKQAYETYDRNGYFSDDGPDAPADHVSLTLDYGFADASTACAFEKMGKSADAKRLRERSLVALRAHFDSQSGLMRPKDSGGRFSNNFDATRWGFGYVEGSPWHHSFPPYAPRELAKLHGSEEKLARKIHEMLVTPGTFGTGSYGQQIHEMTEMRAFALGQYGHNNQPSHHILHLLLTLGGMPSPGCAAPECDEAHSECLPANLTIARAAAASEGRFCARSVAEAALHDVLERGYGTEHYAGDEDNGEMGAWYVLTALGLFEPAPGTLNGYALGSPLFRRVAIWRGLDGDRARQGGSTPTLTIESRRAGTLAVRHVARVLLDGADVGRRNSSGGSAELDWTVSHEQLFGAAGRWRRGSTLRFLTGAETLGGDQPTVPHRTRGEQPDKHGSQNLKGAALPAGGHQRDERWAGGAGDRLRASMAAHHHRFGRTKDDNVAGLVLADHRTLEEQELDAATVVLPLVTLVCFVAFVYFRRAAKRGQEGSAQRMSKAV